MQGIPTGRNYFPSGIPSTWKFLQSFLAATYSPRIPSGRETPLIPSARPQNFRSIQIFLKPRKFFHYLEELFYFISQKTPKFDAFNLRLEIFLYQNFLSVIMLSPSNFPIITYDCQFKGTVALNRQTYIFRFWYSPTL